MKVVVENIIASCRVSGNLDLARISDNLPGSDYRPSVFKGIIHDSSDPPFKMIFQKDGTIKLHGLTSEEKVKEALEKVLGHLRESGIQLKIEEPLKVNEVIASFDMGDRLDPKVVYEEFKEDGVVYDPAELPGFLLPVGNSGIEVLIFPEGKVVSRGADNLLDAVSSLQLVQSRMRAED